MEDSQPISIFFGYPSNPNAQKEAVVAAAQRLNASTMVKALLWESLGVAGQFIIDPILKAIDDARLAAFDVTWLNQNVMFELGYSIGTDQRIWLFRDETDVDAGRKWNRVKILTTIGYSPFTNSDHLVKAFWEARPDNNNETIFGAAIKDYLHPVGVPDGLFYLPSLYETEAGRKLTRRVRQEANRTRCIAADPEESSVRSLSWYAQSIYSSAVVVAHFCSPNRLGSEVHNARCALVAGLARGMKRPLLMLADGDYTAPIDYRDLIHIYPSAQDCVRTANDWLAANLPRVDQQSKSSLQSATGTSLEVELRSLRLGDPVAENEARDLSEYFIETTSFNEVLDRKATVFVGRKGTGKSANMIEAGLRLSRDRRNLVCVMKPAAYELGGILELMRNTQGTSQQGYVVESLWKFLVYSEMACAAYAEIKQRPVLPASDSDEYAFLVFMDGEGSFIRDEFTVRLEGAVERLLGTEQQRSVSGQRTAIAEALHRGLLLQLREHLGKVLSQKRRVSESSDKSVYPRSNSSQTPRLDLLLQRSNSQRGQSWAWESGRGRCSKGRTSLFPERADLPPENESRSNVTLERENSGYWAEERGHLNWAGRSTRRRRSSAS